LIQYFNEDIGPQFPNGFDTIIASAKDYFDLMFDANIMTNFVIDIPSSSLLSRMLGMSTSDSCSEMPSN
jgi:hypothetical protein